jgi:hypothetical protein
VQIMRARIRTVVTVGSAAALVMALGFGASPVLASARSGEAPGAPGAASDWVTGDKDGFGTARGTDSKVWYTLNNGELSEIYYPRIPWPGQPARQCHQFPDRPAQARDHRMVSFPRVTARQMQEDGMIMAMQHRVTRSRR